MTKHRHHEALVLLQKMAKYNGKKKLATINTELSDCLTHLLHSDTSQNINNTVPSTLPITASTLTTLTTKSNTITATTTNATKTNKFRSLFTPWSSFVQTLSFIYIWFTASLVYYGLSLGITDLDALLNPYWTFFVSAVAEIIGYLACKLNDRFGRKRMFIAFFVFIVASCLVEAACLAWPQDGSHVSGPVKSALVVKIVFAGVSKAAASAVFDSCYVYNSLFYTTDVRATAVLFSANMGVVGSFLSPQIRFLSELFWAPLAFLVYAASALGALGVLCLLSDPSRMQFN